MFKDDCLTGQYKYVYHDGQMEHTRYDMGDKIQGSYRRFDENGIEVPVKD